MKVLSIINGWKHLLEGENQDLVLERGKICIECPFRTRSQFIVEEVFGNRIEEISDYKCGACGCALNAKLRLRSEECPKGKW